MRDFMLLAFMLLSITTSAQTFRFVTQSTSDMRQIADSIVLNAKRTYAYNKEGESKDNSNYYILSYKNVADSTDKMNVFFRINMIGSSDALKKEGTAEYQFYAVAGKFLDLYPFWHKFINPNSAIETVAEEKQDNRTTDNILFSIKEWGTYWKIEAHPIMN
jgi:hypothetical protein